MQNKYEIAPPRLRQQANTITNISLAPRIFKRPNEYLKQQGDNILAQQFFDSNNQLLYKQLLDEKHVYEQKQPVFDFKQFLASHGVNRQVANSIHQEYRRKQLPVQRELQPKPIAGIKGQLSDITIKQPVQAAGQQKPQILKTLKIKPQQNAQPSAQQLAVLQEIQQQINSQYVDLIVQSVKQGKPQEAPQQVKFLDEKLITKQLKPQKSAVEQIAREMLEKYNSHAKNNQASQSTERPIVEFAEKQMGQSQQAADQNADAAEQGKKQQIWSISSSILSAESGEDTGQMIRNLSIGGQQYQLNFCQFKNEQWLDDHGVMFGLHQILPQNCFVADPNLYFDVKIMQSQIVLCRNSTYKWIVAPLCEDMHWICLAFETNNKRLFMFDGLNIGASRNKINVFIQFCSEIVGEHLTLGNLQGTKANYTFERVRITYQKNSYDCGVFCILGAAKLVEGSKIEISENECTNYRKQMLKLGES